MRHPLPFRFIAPIALTLICGAATAHAEVVAGSENVPPVSEAPMGRVAVRRGVQGPAGLFTARLNLLVNASKGSFGKPTSFAPDLFYSITDNVQIGLVHTGPMGWQSLPGAGLCFNSEANGCPNGIYDNVGLDFMYGLLFGDFHLSLHSSLYLLQIADPVWPMWTIGLTGKFHFTDMVALYFDPQIGITLANRGEPFRKEWLFLPVELQFQLGQMVSLKVLSGVTGQLSNLGDTVRSPLGLGVVANVTPNLDLGLRFSFDNLLGHVPVGSRTDERSLALLVNIRI